METAIPMSHFQIGNLARTLLIASSQTASRPPLIWLPTYSPSKPPRLPGGPQTADEPLDGAGMTRILSEIRNRHVPPSRADVVFFEAFVYELLFFQRFVSAVLTCVGQQYRDRIVDGSASSLLIRRKHQTSRGNQVAAATLRGYHDLLC